LDCKPVNRKDRLQKSDVSAGSIQRDGANQNPNPAPAATTNPSHHRSAQTAALTLAGTSIDTGGTFLLFTTYSGWRT